MTGQEKGAEEAWSSPSSEKPAEVTKPAVFVSDSDKKEIEKSSAPEHGERNDTDRDSRQSRFDGGRGRGDFGGRDDSRPDGRRGGRFEEGPRGYDRDDSRRGESRFDDRRDFGRDSYRGRDGPRDGYRGREGPRDDYRGRDEPRDGYRGRDEPRDSYRWRDESRDGYRGRDGSRDGYRGRYEPRDGYRGRDEPRDEQYGKRRGDYDDYEYKRTSYMSRDEPPRRSSSRNDEAAPNETLGLFGLDFQLIQPDFEDYLRSKLSKFEGKYTSKLIMDRMTGKCKGFGFVTFENLEDATEGKDLLSDGEIRGRPFRVAFSIGDRRPARDAGYN